MTRAKLHATGKRIWRMVEEKEEIKEAEIAARSGPRVVVVVVVVVEVVVTEATIIEIMATVAFI